MKKKMKVLKGLLVHEVSIRKGCITVCSKSSNSVKMGPPLYSVSFPTKYVLCYTQFCIEQYQMTYVKDKVTIGRFIFHIRKHILIHE